MHWVYLLGAGLLEVVWALAMKLSHGFERPMPTAVMVIAMIGSVVLLTLSMRQLPLGTAYAIWTGIGTLGAFVLGIVVLGEAATATRLVAAALILAGLVLMKLGTEG